ncbi:MAG: CPBP family intramembrane glutamic endopeptidase [Acidimicrobiales bacterium]
MERPEPPAVRPGVVVVWAAGGFVLGQAVATVLVGLAAGVAGYPGGLTALAHAVRNPWWASAASLVGLWCGFAAAIVAARRVGGLQPWPHQWRPRAADAWYLVVGVVAQFAVILAYRPFHVRHLGRPATRLFGATSGASFVLLALLTTVGAPLIEEWFFRGVLLRGLRGLLGRLRGRVAATLAVVLSAVAFALAHGEPTQFAGLAALGVVLAVLALRTRRLVPSALTHLSFNAVAVGALVAQRMH